MNYLWSIIFFMSPLCAQAQKTFYTPSSECRPPCRPFSSRSLTTSPIASPRQLPEDRRPLAVSRLRRCASASEINDFDIIDGLYEWHLRNR